VLQGSVPVRKAWRGDPEEKGDVRHSNGRRRPASSKRLVDAPSARVAIWCEDGRTRCPSPNLERIKAERGRRTAGSYAGRAAEASRALTGRQRMGREGQPASGSTGEGANGIRARKLNGRELDGLEPRDRRSGAAGGASKKEMGEDVLFACVKPLGGPPPPT